MLQHSALVSQWKLSLQPMINLKNRSNEKELLDEDSIPFPDIQQNMKELNTINTLLGGHAVTLSGIKYFKSDHFYKNGISICEIGCGGGDNLHAISKWCQKNGIEATFTGIDIKKECIDFAKLQYPLMKANWITKDFSLVDFKYEKPAIIFSSLFCHHFTEMELAKMIKWMKQNSTLGFFINDLHRHRLAYYFIHLLTFIFSRSYLVKNDAPLSVAKGFRIPEWKNILALAGISHYKINWKWAFRHLIVSKNEG